MSNKTKLIGLIVVFIVAGLYYLLPYYSDARAIAQLVERNLEARGGHQKWQAVKALRITGQMDVGQGVALSYTLDQQRPNKMCLEFVFDEQTTIQCSSGHSGWKIVPFRGRNKPEALTSKELQESADSVDLYGLLYNYSERGIKIEILGHEVVDGIDAIKLKLTLPQGAQRWLFLNSETALEVKLESMRNVRGKPRLVETYYKNWKPTEDGLLISRRQETKTQGDDTFHFLTIDKIEVNPTFSANRFDMPSPIKIKNGH